MRKKVIGFALSAILLALCLPASAQQPTKGPRIGYLTADSRSARADVRAEAFRQGLRELGYMEGKTVVIEWRSAEGKRERLSVLAAELVRLKVDIIVTGGPTATRPVKEATTTIPIVMTQDAIRLGTALSPVWRVLVGTLRGCPTLPRS